MSGNELQDDEIIEPASQEIDQDIEQGEEGSDLATETQAEAKKPHVEFNPEQQEKVEKLIAKKTWEKREAERQLEAERQRTRQLEAEMEKLRVPVVDIPPMPDPYEEGFEEKVKIRDQAIALRAAHDAQNYQRQQALQAQEQEASYRRQAEIEQKVSEYKSNALKYGVKQEELTQAAQTVANYGINEDLALAIIGDEQGALITTYLADNIEDLDKVVRMTPVQAAMYIASVVKPKAQARKPKVSNAPDPTPVVKGNGAPESKSPLLKGVTYR